MKALLLSNPFACLMVVLNLASAAWEMLRNHDNPKGVMFVCYAIATVCIIFRKP